MILALFVLRLGAPAEVLFHCLTRHAKELESMTQQHASEDRLTLLSCSAASQAEQAPQGVVRHEGVAARYIVVPCGVICVVLYSEGDSDLKGEHVAQRLSEIVMKHNKDVDPCDVEGYHRCLRPHVAALLDEVDDRGAPRVSKGMTELVVAAARSDRKK